MGRVLRNPARLSAILALVAILAVSFLLAGWLGRDAKTPAALQPVAGSHAPSLNHFRAGLESERQGRLAEALSAYERALAAQEPALRAAADEAIARVWVKRKQGLSPWAGFYWDDVLLVLKTLRPVFLILLLLLALDLALQKWVIAIKPFAVFGTAEPSASEAFRQYFTQAFRRHQQIFSRRHPQFIGGVPIGNMAVTSQDADRIGTRALEAAKGGEIKAAVGFSVGELLRFVQNIGKRPAYFISGQVRLVSDHATVSCELRRRGRGSRILRTEASSLEFLSAASPGPATGPARPLRFNEDLRANHEQLSQAASVLAAKLWFELLQTARSDLRPASWRTLLRLSRAMRSLSDS
jgi:hypothetical protein